MYVHAHNAHTVHTTYMYETEGKISLIHDWDPGKSRPRPPVRILMISIMQTGKFSYKKLNPGKFWYRISHL